jgi:hypothetical protein
VIVQLKTRGLLSDVDVDRNACEHGGYCQRELPAKHFTIRKASDQTVREFADSPLEGNRFEISIPP